MESSFFMRLPANCYSFLSSWSPHSAAVMILLSTSAWCFNGGTLLLPIDRLQCWLHGSIFLNVRALGFSASLFTLAPHLRHAKWRNNCQPKRSMAFQAKRYFVNISRAVPVTLRVFYSFRVLFISFEWITCVECVVK